MRKNLKRIYSISAVAMLLGAVLLSTACIRENAASAGSSEESSAATAETAEIRAAKELIEKAPNSPQGYSRLAVAYIRQARETGDFKINEKANEAVSKALEIDADNFEANKIRASLLLTFHQFPEALILGGKLQQKYPDDAFFYGVLTDANVEIGNYEAALENVQKMVDMRPDTASYSRVAHVRSLYGDSEGAINAMTTAARIADPADKEAQAWCLVRLAKEYFEIGDYQKAEQTYDEALSTFPDYHLALAGKGKILLALEKPQEAITFLENSQARSKSTETAINLGHAFTKLGNPDEARRYYEIAAQTEMGPESIDHRKITLLWADRGENLPKALEIAAFEAKTHRDIYTADSLAWCLYKSGKIDEAKVQIANAMRLNTKDAIIIYHAGMIELEAGNKVKAKQLLTKALKLNPKFDPFQAETAKSTLESLS